LLEPARANSVGPFFVFLNLLKRQTQSVAQFFLTHAEHDTPHTDAAANVPIDRVRYFFHEFRSNRHTSAAALQARGAERYMASGSLYRKCGPRPIGGPDFSPEAQFMLSTMIASR
jgi:hypothetical protein